MHPFHDTYEEHNIEIPPNVMSSQPPQLGASICCHARDCESCQNISEGSDESENSEAALNHGGRCMDDEESENVNTDADSVQDGDEGVRDYQMESRRSDRLWIGINDYGLVSDSYLRVLLANTAAGFIRRCGVIPEDYSPETSVLSSGSGTPDSMSVGAGSGLQSLQSSTHLTPPMGSPSVYLAFMGGEPYFPPTPANHFTSPPIWLCPDPPSWTHPTLDLVISEGDSSEDDA